MASTCLWMIFMRNIPHYISEQQLNQNKMIGHNYQQSFWQFSLDYQVALVCVAQPLDDVVGVQHHGA